MKNAVGVAAVLGAISVLAPPSASAGLLDDVGRGVNDTVNRVNDTVRNLAGGGGGGGAAPAPAPSAGPVQQDATVDPQPETTDPHATASVLDVAIPVLDENDDLVVVGRSDSSQDANGDYHGKVTVVSALGLEVAIETDEGQQESGLTGPLNNLLQTICNSSGNNVCLTVLDAQSETTGNRSTNSFSAVDASVGEGLIAAEVLESNSELEDDGDCQTATAHSEATNVGALGVLSADTLESDSSSFACRDGSQGSSGNSSLGGVDPVIALSTIVGCDNTQESEFEILLILVPLADGVCNGTNTSQLVPFNVQKALQLDLVPALLPDALIELVAASSETLAQAPEGPVCPDPTNPVCDPPPPPPPCANPPCGNEGKNPPDRFGPGRPGRPTAADTRRLPFTGADLGVLLLIGAGVMGTGLGLMGLADRRRRLKLKPQ